MSITIKFTDLDAQLETVGANKGGSKFQDSPYLSSGTHTVKIIEASVAGPNKVDPNWYDLSLIVEASNGKTRKGKFLVPTSKLTFGNWDSKREYFRFRELLKAIGVSEAAMREEMAKLVDTLLNNTASLMDMQVSVVVGYNDVHPKKNEDGTWMVANYKGERLAFAVRKNEKGESEKIALDSKSFPDRDALLAFCDLKGIWIQRGPTITKVLPVEGAAPLSTTTVKKSAKKPTENSPF